MAAEIVVIIPVNNQITLSISNGNVSLLTDALPFRQMNVGNSVLALQMRCYES